MVGQLRANGATILVVTLWLAAHGCRTVNDGAVELSWKLRPASGPLANNPCDPFVCCDSGQHGAGAVKRIRLDWQVDQTHGSNEWRCEDSHGVTGFDLPPGQALLSVSPVCANGTASTNTYIAPAPEQRTVIVGDTVILGALELVLQVSSCDQQPCICQ